MSSGGTLTIGTGGTTSPPPVAGAPASDANDWARIVIRDTGVGIPPDVQARMFEPFFTTKPPGAGTGMGLATVKRIIDEAGGRIEVASVPGTGTTITVWLPAAAPELEIVEPHVPAVAPQGQGETVLLCEDDDDLRELAARALHVAGYQVLSARTPARALELARRAARPISLLISDVVLPGMSGPELAARLVKLAPDVRVLYVSGYPAGLGPESAAYEFLAKPFEPAALLVRVRATLDQNPVSQG
jgi:CheY-like chemotaxis protein